MASVFTATARRVALLALAALALHGQQVTTNRVTILPSADDAATGELRFREKQANGSNNAIIKAPSSIAADFTLTLPAALPGGTGYCLVGNTSGVLSFSSTCGAGGSSIPFDDKTATPSTNPIIQNHTDNTKQWGFDVSAITTGTVRTSTVPNADFTFAGLELAQTFTATNTFRAIKPSADNTYDNGTASFAWGTVYGHNANFAPSGETGNQTSVRDLLILDQSGLTPGWVVQCSANPAGNSNCRFKDNGGTDVLRLNATTGGATTRYGEMTGDWRPATTATYDIGVTGTRWRAGYFSSNVNAAGIITTSTSSMEQINPATAGSTTLGGGTGSRWGKLWVQDIDIGGTCTGCGGLPVVDTTSVVKGSADATKLLRFEVDGFTTATTRVLTPQDASYTIAGLEQAQTFSAIQTVSLNSTGTAVLRLRNQAADGYSVDEFYSSVNVSKGFVGWSNASASVLPSAMVFGTTGADSVKFMTSAAGRWEITSAGVLQPISTLDLGGTASANRIATLYGDNANFARAGITGNFVAIRDLQVIDSAGGTTGYVVQAQASGVTSGFTVKDNAGNFPLRLMRTEASVTTDNAYFDLNVLPTGTRNIGASGTKWQHGYFSGTVNANAVVTTSTSTMAQINPASVGVTTFGGSSFRWGTIYGTAADFTTGTFSGAITVASCTGCGGGLPTVDTTSIVQGSSDATKLLRFEVDGFTAATTRVLTPQNASYIIAGTDITNTFSVAQTFGAMPTFTFGAAGATVAELFNTSTSGYSAIRSRDSSGAEQGFAGWANSLAGVVAEDASFARSEMLIGTKNASPLGFFTNNSVRWQVDSSGNFVPAASVTYSIGSSSKKVNNVFTNSLHVYSNALFDGNVQGALIDKGGSVYDIRSYGAVCDGSTDDRAALIAAVAAAPVGGTVYIPPTSSGCAFSAYSQTKNVNIIGGGAANTRIIPLSTGTLLFFNFIAYNWHLEGFSIDASALGSASTLIWMNDIGAGSLVKDIMINGRTNGVSNGASITGIHLSGTSSAQKLGRVNFTNLLLTNLNYGIYIEGDTVGELYFSDSQLFSDQTSFTTTAPIYYTRSTNADQGSMNFDNIMVTNGGTTITSGMKFTSSVANTRAFITINHCIVDGITGSAYDFTNISEVKLQGSWGYSSSGASSSPVLKIYGGDSIHIHDNRLSVAGSANPGVIYLDGAPARITFANNLYDGAHLTGSTPDTVFAINNAAPPTRLSIMGDTQTSAGPMIGLTYIDKFVAATENPYKPIFTGVDFYTDTDQGSAVIRFCNDQGNCRPFRSAGANADLAILNNTSTQNNAIFYNNGDLAIWGSLINNQNPPITIAGSAATNGNIVLNPGAVAGNAGVVTNCASVGEHCFTIKDKTGSTSVAPNALQLLDSSGTSYFKVISAADTGSPGTVVTKDIVPRTGSTFDLGKTFNRWNAANLNTLDVLSISNFAGTMTTRSLVPAFSGDTIGGPLARYGGVYANAVNVYGFLTTRGVLPELSSTYNIGTSINRFASIYGDFVGAYVQLYAKEIFVDNSGIKWVSGAGDLGQTTVRPPNTYLSNVNINGTVTTPSGNTGVNFNYACPSGTAIKTLNVSGGMITGATCGAP